MSLPDPTRSRLAEEQARAIVPDTVLDRPPIRVASRTPSDPVVSTTPLSPVRSGPPGQPVSLPITPPPGIPVPDLRTRPPVPVVPWSTRAQRWVRERTQPGRIETECDAKIADFIAMMSSGCHILATIGPKGGPGKTTVALATGLVLAEVPLARPIVVELNPDWGTIDQVLGRRCDRKPPP